MKVETDEQGAQWVVLEQAESDRFGETAKAAILWLTLLETTAARTADHRIEADARNARLLLHRLTSNLTAPVESQ